MIKHRYIPISFSVLALSAIAACILLAFNPTPAQAISAGEWRAGRIVDDGIFRNSQSMSTEQIQNFLNSKVPNCDTNGTQQSEYGGGTRAEYGAAHGAPAPYTCLKDYHENGLSAAQIIKQYAVQYNINPQVLLVLLQKEQRLITDDWPWPVQYKSATGYGCPDTAECDSQYKNFTMQVKWAARMFQAISDRDPDWYSPYVKGSNFIQWHPNSSCGGTTVNVENWSTAALYSYTPYQPNSAALNAGYGTGDSCSSYGNRNFWLYFSDWFGSIYSYPMYANVVNAVAYTGSNKATMTNVSSMLPGRSAYIVATLRNTGTKTWKKTDIRLATSGPRDRSSVFYDPTWLSNNRVAMMKEDTVAPGAVATFEYWYKAPTFGGTFNETFSVVDDKGGGGWSPDFGLTHRTKVADPVYAGQIVSARGYTNSAETTGFNVADLRPENSMYIVTKVKNTGNMTWTKARTRVAGNGPWDRSSDFEDQTWISANRITNMQEDTVAPGETATFEYWYKAPAKAGTFNEHFAVVIDGVSWAYGSGFTHSTTIPGPVYSAENVSTNVYTSSNKTTSSSLATMQAGTSKYIVTKVKNTGQVTWQRETTRLATTNPQDRTSAFKDATWMSGNRVVRMTEATVAPGATATFEYWYKAPTQAKDYTEDFSVVIEGKSWIPYFGIRHNTTVTQ